MTKEVAGASEPPHPAQRPRRPLRILGVVVALVLMQRVHAAHPLQTEDTATQGTAVLELENGFAWAQQADNSAFVCQPQVALGVTPTLDLIMQPSWLSTRIKGERSVHGFGDTNLDAKWRFREDPAWSVAMRSGLTLATSDHELGIPHGKVGAHLTVAATWAFAQAAVHGNVGVSYLPTDASVRATTGHAFAALVWRPIAHWALVAEGGADSSVERGSGYWPFTALIGVAHSVRPGFDLDIGYRLSFDRGATTRVLLFGATWHFAR